MSSVPVLYHAESSFYSQRARLSLAEKGIRYKSHLINLLAGDIHKEWFMRNINPKGQVPAMEHLGQFYTDSQDIIEYVDTLPSDKPKLCPNDGSEIATKVGYFRDKLGAINVAALTYGSVYHRHLTVNAVIPSFLTKDRIKGLLKGTRKNLASLTEKKPDLIAGLNQRRGISDISEIIFDEEKVITILNDVDRIMDEVEEELRKQKAEFGDEEYWLCGQTFTIADIFLSCLLHRFTFVGQAERFFMSKRPLLADYYKRVLLRKSFRKECVYANNLFWSMFMPLVRLSMKKARPFIFGISAVVIGVFAYYRKEEIIDLGNEMFAKLKNLFTKVDAVQL